MQGHSPYGAVLNPSQLMCNHSSHNSHCTMSSQYSSIEQWQNKSVSQVCLLLNLALFDYRGKGSKTTFLQHLTKCLPIFPLSKETSDGSFPAASSYALTIRMFWIKDILYYALKRKVSYIFTRTLRMMFSLSFVGGSKSARTPAVWSEA